MNTKLQRLGAKRDSELGVHLTTDLGEPASNGQEAPISASGPTTVANGGAAPIPPILGSKGAPDGPDRARVQALVRAALQKDPTLRLTARPKAPRERASLTFDGETTQRLSDYAAKQIVSRASLMGLALDWAPPNADTASILWAHDELAGQRKTALRQASLSAGELPSGNNGLSVDFAIPSLKATKPLWNSTGLSRKAFLEACLYLFAEVHFPRKR